MLAQYVLSLSVCQAVRCVLLVLVTVQDDKMCMYMY